MHITAAASRSRLRRVSVFLHLLRGARPGESYIRAMHTSLNHYAEHEFNASTFTARSIAGTGADIH